MRAVLLAAGEGSRLRPHTLERPKCLVELGGRSLLDHQLAVLRDREIHDVHIVTGYRSHQLEAYGYPTFHNPDFDKTNMVTSLMCAADFHLPSIDPAVTLHRTVALPGSRKKLDASRFLVGVLPLHPLWPGFAINTIFYALIVWGLNRVRRCATAAGR